MARRPPERTASPSPSPREACAQVLDDERPRLDPGDAKGDLEIADESRGGTRRRALRARRARPARRGPGAVPGPPRSTPAEPEGAAGAARRGALRRISSSAHLAYTGRACRSNFFLSSSSERSWPRQREILLAIVPAGSSSVLADRTITLVAGRRSDRGSRWHSGPRRARASRTVRASSSARSPRPPPVPRVRPTSTTRFDDRSRSRQQFRVSWPIQGRIASSERSVSSRS